MSLIMAHRIVMLSLLFVGCSNAASWSGVGQKICAGWIEQAAQEQAAGTHDYRYLVQAIRDAGGPEEFVAGCVEAVKPGIEACHEHRYGTDTAESCAERRVYPLGLAYMKKLAMAVVDQQWQDTLSNIRE